MAFRKIAIVAIVSFIICIPYTAYADAPYKGYSYDAKNNAIASPNGYIPGDILTGKSLGVGDFNAPQDLFVDNHKNIYIMDTGNNRIVILDASLKWTKTIDHFLSDKGEEKLKDATGLYVDRNGTIYIADSGNGRILICDQNGKVQRILGKPKSALIPADLNYEPRKVLVDSSGVIYVLSKNTNMGAISMDQSGVFLGFFGANKVQSTLELLQEMFWRSFASKQQLAKMQKFTPVEFSNLALDSKDFIYTVTAFDGGRKDDEDGLIRKLNPSGNNILAKKTYGDLQVYSRTGTTFVDVNVDDEDFFYGLDRDRGRLFEYDEEGNLLFIFGAKDTKKGTFQDPVAVDHLDGNILVLDAAKRNITVFEPTTFATTVRKAVTLYNHGEFEAALEPWRQILMRDSNFDLAYVGIGKALYNLHQYKEAMINFKLGNDKDDYSIAKRQYRTLMLREHFSQIVFGLLALMIIYWLIRHRKKWKRLFAGKKEERREYDIV